MSNNHPQLQSKEENETYLKVWQTEQDFNRTSWTIVTFFMSVSFAVFGFSFQTALVPPRVLAIRIASLMIYWFAYILHMRFFRYTKSLRRYLIEMEKSSKTTLDIQSKTGRPINVINPLATNVLLFYFGIVYTIGVVILRLLSL